MMSNEWFLYATLVVLVVVVMLAIRAYRSSRIPMTKYISFLITAANLTILAVVVLFKWDVRWAITIGLTSCVAMWLVERKSKQSESMANH